MKNLTIDGRIGSELTKRQTQNGVPFLSFSLGVNIFRNGETTTEWWNIADYNMNDEGKYHVGDYILLNGKDFYSKVNVVEDKETKKKVPYLNHYATATQINVILRKNREQTKVDEGTAPVINMPSFSVPAAAPVSPAPTPVPTPAPAIAAVGTASQTVDDDLPF